MTTRKFNQLLVSLGVTITLLTNAYPQAARTVMVQSNSGVLLFPTNLFTANAASARSGLSLATHATNPIVPLTSGGSGATNAATARTNFGLVWSGLTNSNAADFRSALSLGTAATNDAAIFQPASAALTNLAAGNGAALTNLSSSNVSGLQAVLDGKLSTNGSGAALTNLTGASVTGPVALASNVTGTVAITNGGSGATSAAGARTNLGLGLAALTNTSVSGFVASLFGANTNPVLVNTNGIVVSPTNFWQTAPVYSTIQNSLPAVSSTNTAFNSRSLILNSLAPSISGVTNTIELVTSGAFAGDTATVTHRGPTNSLTQIIQQDLGAEILSMNGLNQTAKFIFDGTNWSVAPSQSFTEPVYFSGTNASANAATSRTNLGLGAGNIVSFSGLNLSSILQFVEGSGTFVGGSNGLGLYNALVFKTNVIETYMPFQFLTNFNNSAAITRTNLGLGATWLTNTNVTNFRTAIGLGATNNVNFNAIDGLDRVGFSDHLTMLQVGSTQLGARALVIRITNSEIGYFSVADFRLNTPINFYTNTQAATTRTNLDLGLPALTNTSNATMMRALSGSTNTNHPFSGTVSVVGTNNTNTLTFSNGILQSVQ